MNENSNLPIVTNEAKDISLQEFFSAFGYSETERIFFRTFHDADKSISGKKLDCEMRQLDAILPTLKKNNSQRFGIFFVVNGNGQTDNEVKKSGKCKAQFMEIDDKSMDEQLKLINVFTLRPSIVVRTRKSLHCYWILIDGDIKLFRDIQLRLISYFNSDRSIQNESRVMRVPTFNHCKSDPIRVEILYFHPELKYTQQQLLEVLPEVKKNTSSVQGNKTDRSDIKRQIEELAEVEGNRHDALKSFIGSIMSRSNYKLEDSAYEAILREANKNLKEPIPDKEFELTVLPMVKNFRKAAIEAREQFAEESATDFRNRFHVWSKPSKEGLRVPIDIIDSEIVEDIINTQNIIIISGIPYLYHDGFYEQDETGNSTREIIKKYIFKRLQNVNRINRVYNLLVMDTSIVKDIDEVNAYPKSWINFKNGMLDALTMKMQEHSPEYYSINQIPWDYEEGYIIPDDSIVVRCLKEKIPDEEDREMFLQFNGYGMTTDTHAQKFMVYFGDGNTGKSTLIRLQDAMIGKQNKTSLSLQDINKRFFPTCLFGKLMNLCADIPSEAMSAIDVLKKATGEDQIMGEYKGGAVFFFKSYAKLLFSANSIPLSYDDKTNAFYRRMLLLEIQRGEFMTALEDKLHEDMQTYIHLCVDALHRMYEKGQLSESQNSKNEVEKLRKKADTVFAFLADKCERDNSATIKRNELYDLYSSYCTEQDRTALTKHRFYSTLEDNGIPTRTGDAAMYIKGIREKFESPFD